MKKQVELVMAPREPHFVGDGFRVHNFIPSAPRMDMVRMDPFIMLDYNSRHHFPATETPRGVGVHPHKGFETVTIVYEGKVEHGDSYGGGGVIGEGEVQWMTAGSGLLHKEFHETEWSKAGGHFHVVQLWVNLPAKDKSTQPKYQAITKEKMESIKLPTGGEVRLIAGSYNGYSGPASTFSPVHLSNAYLNAGEIVNYSFPAEYTVGLLAIKGSVTINETEQVAQDHFALMSHEGEDFSMVADEDAIILVMAGEPLEEPIAASGPFVMNTREELMQAYQDFNNGKFGQLS